MKERKIHPSENFPPIGKFRTTLRHSLHLFTLHPVHTIVRGEI